MLTERYLQKSGAFHSQKRLAVSPDITTGARWLKAKQIHGARRRIAAQGNIKVASVANLIGDGGGEHRGEWRLDNAALSARRRSLYPAHIHLISACLVCILQLVSVK
jgi:hypothetical protein